MKFTVSPKHRRRAAGAVLAGLVLLGVWYHVPLRRTLETEICGNDGTSAVLRMEITLHRSFFRETMVRGTMELDGASYVSAPRMEGQPSSFLEGLRDKWSGSISSGYFVEAERLAGRGTAIDMKEDSLRIYDVSFRGFYESIAHLFLIRWRPDAPSVVYTVEPPTY